MPIIGIMSLIAYRYRHYLQYSTVNCNQHPSRGPDSFAATNSLMIVDWRLLALPVVSVHRYLSILCSHAQGMCMGYLGNCAISFLTDIDSLFSGF